MTSTSTDPHQQIQLGGDVATGTARRPLSLVPLSLVVRSRDGQVPLVFVGPRDAQADVEDMAARHGRHIDAHVDLPQLHQRMALAVPDGPFDLVLHATAFDAVRDQAPRLLDGAREVRLLGCFRDPDGGGSIQVDDPWAATVPRRWAVVRRILDVAVASTGLVVLLPVLVLAALAIRLETPGNPVFTQIRMGRHGRRFRLHKLRTMRAGCSDLAHRRYVSALIRGEAAPVTGVFKLVDDPRITRVGRVLRRFSIDEIPQLWNVLRGEMSLIGPRPDLPSTMVQCAGYVWGRNLVRPGLTGLWQVSGRCALPFPEMIALDLRYCTEVGPGLDAAILARTPMAVIKGTGSA